MEVWKKVVQHLVPTRGNAYRPHLLGRRWLIFFFCMSLAAEGFLVTSLVARQSDQAFLAAAGSVSGAEANSLGQSLGRQFVRLISSPEEPTQWLLSGLATLLVLLLGLAFFLHIEVQPKDMLLGGTVVVAIVFLFLFANARFLTSPSSSVAQVGAAANASR